MLSKAGRFQGSRVYGFGLRGVLTFESKSMGGSLGFGDHAVQG